MSQCSLVPIDQKHVSPLAISAEDEGPTGLFHGAPQPPACRPWEKTNTGSRAMKSKWLDDGVFYLVSPLDSANMTEVELTEEQEVMLNWLDKNPIAHVRVKE